MTLLHKTLPAASLFLSILSAAAQSTPASAPPAATLKVNVQVVTLTATVRDKHGAIVPNLTKEDFTLTEDGRPQTIKYFSHDPNLPLNLGLLVDTSMSQRNVIDSERTASQHFLDQMMNAAQDKAFLIQFDREVDLLADLTADKSKLHDAIGQLGAPQMHNTGNSGDDSDNSDHHMGGGGTTLYDAIYLASDELMKKQPDRKALIILTDGVDRGSKESLFSAIEAAQRANTVVYAIYFKGEESGGGNNNGYGHHRGGMGGGWPGGGGGGYPGGGGGWPGGGSGRTQRPTEGSRIDGKKVLEQICGETGGHMFEANKKDSVDQAYATIAEELKAQYLLGYTPDKQSSGYHKIALTTNKKDLSIQTRQGYYSGE